eukprot:SAG31_NODE_35709_length_320_cov_1.176471_1_plen_30_part_10
MAELVRQSSAQQLAARRAAEAEAATWDAQT